MSGDAGGSFWADDLNPKGLSQGDILADTMVGAPWAPMTFLGQDSWTRKGTDKVYFPKRDRLEPFTGDPGGLYIAKGRFGLAMVINHNCDLDDVEDTARILVAPISPATGISDPTARARIMAGGRRTFVALPGLPTVGDCYADLRSIAHIDRKLVPDARRLVSMSDGAVLMLRAQLIDYFTRVEPSLLIGALQESMAKENAEPAPAAPRETVPPK